MPKSRQMSPFEIRIAAKKCGVSPDEYEANHSAGRKWCSHHRCFHEPELFGKHFGSTDGLQASCREGMRLTVQRARERKLHPEPRVLEEPISPEAAEIQVYLCGLKTWAADGEAVEGEDILGEECGNYYCD